MAFTFLKKLHNINIGDSLFDKDGYEIVDKLMAKAKANNVKIHLPVDFVCADKFDNNANIKTYDLSSGIPDGWLGLDAGEKTTKLNQEAVRRAEVIVWNGPQGAFEMANFRHGSSQLLQTVMEQTEKGSTSVIGGGDTVNLVKSTPGAD